MKWVWRAHSSADLLLALEMQVGEVLLSPRELSRHGQVDLAGAAAFAHQARSMGLRPVLEWDALMTETSYLKTQALLEGMDWSPWAAARVLDPGALSYLKEKWPELRLQLVLEHGHHNPQAAAAWARAAGPRLERLVLSAELTLEELRSWELPVAFKGVELELLALGRILLFFSPRKLLSAALGEGDEWREALGTSEESPHKGFPLEEGPHGTLMFNVRDLCALDIQAELTALGITHGRLEVKAEHARKLWCLRTQPDFKQSYLQEVGRPLSPGLMRAGRTDVLLKKLRNRSLEGRNTDFLGYVLDARKEGLAALALRPRSAPLVFPLKLQLTTPEGKIKELEVPRAFDARGREVGAPQEESTIFFAVPWGLPTKTAVHLLGQLAALA